MIRFRGQPTEDMCNVRYVTNCRPGGNRSCASDVTEIYLCNKQKVPNNFITNYLTVTAYLFIKTCLLRFEASQSNSLCFDTLRQEFHVSHGSILEFGPRVQWDVQTQDNSLAPFL